MKVHQTLKMFGNVKEYRSFIQISANIYDQIRHFQKKSILKLWTNIKTRIFLSAVGPAPVKLITTKRSGRSIFNHHNARSYILETPSHLGHRNVCMPERVYMCVCLCTCACVRACVPGCYSIQHTWNTVTSNYFNPSKKN